MNLDHVWALVFWGGIAVLIVGLIAGMVLNG